MAQLLEWKVEENEVLLFKSNEPILKVERGTTLDVLKLLYEADPKYHGKVIGLRPLTDERFPCVLTLNHSVLIHSKYEIIVHEEATGQMTKQGLVTDHNKIETLTQDSTGNAAQTRCCSSPQSTKSLHSKWNSSDVDGPLMASNYLSELHDGKPHNMPTRPQGIAAIGSTTPPPAYVACNITKPTNLEPVCITRTVPAEMSFRTRPSFILPKKGPTINGPFYSTSRRKRNARKSTFARKITLMTPNQQGNTSGRFQVQTLAFSQSQDSLTRPSHVIETAALGDKQGLEDDREPAEMHDNTIVSEEEKESPIKDLDEDLSAQPVVVTSGHSSSAHNPPVLYDQNGEKQQFSASNQAEESLVNKPTMPKNGHETPVEGQQQISNLDHHTDTEGSSIDDTEYIEDHIANGRQAEHTLRESDAFRTAVVRLQDTVQVKTEPGGDDVVLEKANVGESSPNGTFQIHDLRGTPDFRNENSLYKHCCETTVPPVLSSSSMPGIHTSENTQMPHLQGNNNCVFPENCQLATSQTNSSLPDVSHKSNQPEEIVHKCNECLKIFETPGSLDRHKRSHSGERPYVCRVCSWGFTTMGNLNQHMAIHQKVKPFKCVYCGKTFARSNVLKAHVRGHTGERPFQCELCGSKFVIEHNLKKHLLMRHQVEVSSERFVGDARS